MPQWIDKDAQPEVFAGFGGTDFASGIEPPLCEAALDDHGRAARATIRRLCPPLPGVYGMLDGDGLLIYVGVSRSLRQRLLSYCSAAADSKSQRILRHARRLVWEVAPHELLALVRELELIRRWQPKFNVKGRQGRIRRSYLCLGRGPAPHVYLARQPCAADGLLIAPFPATRRARRAIALLNNWFGLRDCPQQVPIIFRDQRELFDQPRDALCLRHAMGDCLGPCAALCSSADYAARVQAAREFLAGRGQMLPQLQGAMRAAALAQQFERAAVLRDLWNELRLFDQQLLRLRTAARDYRFIYPVPDYRRGQNWLLIERGQVVCGRRAPRGRRGAQRWLRLLEQVAPQSLAVPQAAPADPAGTLAGEDAARRSPIPEDLDATLLVIHWFRKHRSELDRVIPLDEARRVCREHAGD